MKKSLKKIIFKLLDEDKLTDQNIINELGELPNLQTVMNYKYQWLKLNYERHRRRKLKRHN